jgi:indolepyruvate ferredoxin oxidoreductase alpha subunit
MSERKLLLGDEAIALGALHAGISAAYGYPGTPSTEIFEYVEANKEAYGVHATWSANEKVAYESALGMSFAGKRSLVTMKHVGLNVAADAFVNSGVTGVHGGLVCCVADDPGMHSSQNEQDTRYYARFALVPLLEPSTQQEAYEMMRYGFDLSEARKMPVLLRAVTRLAHSRADVEVGEVRAQNPLNKAPRQALSPNFTLLPTNARVLYQELTEKQPGLLAESEASPFNILSLEGDRKLGIITNGVAYNYVREVFGGTIPHPFLRVGMNPPPMGKIRQLIDAVDVVLFLEEGMPFLEELVRGVVGVPGKVLRGKLDGAVPRSGEMTPSIVGKAVGRPLELAYQASPASLPKRPPALCPGCPHTDTYAAMTEATKEYAQPSTFSDIGCYTLGYYPPHNAIETCVDMGASISMSIGAAHAGLFPVLCALGDSTFGHSGTTGLLTAASENLNMNVFILDNGTVAMTGTQETMTTGEDLVKLVVGLGVDPDHVRLLNPLPKHHDENVRIIKEEIEHEGLSVIISRRACIHIKRRV